MATTLTIAKGDPSDVNVTVNQTDVLVTGQNNVSVEVTPAPRLEINVDYGMIGPQGPQGDAATIAVGTTTTGAAGSSASVTNTGTSSAAVFNFTIPQGIQGIQGVKGDTGATGPTGATGAGVATGGTTGQVLVKASNANYDTSWATITGTLSYQGGWNASTNSPTLTSSVGTNGFYYVVTIAGSTNLNGITDWQIGDWAIFNGSIWQKIDQTNLVTSVNGQTGAVSVGTVTSVSASAGTGISITGSPITTSGTLNITNTAPDQTVVLTGGTGISTSGTYPSFTITNSLPDRTVAISSGTGISVTGTYPNFTVTNTSPSSGGTVTSVTATSPITSTGGTTPIIAMPAATGSVNGYLTSTDWTTFNNKQSAGTYVNSVSGTTGRITSTGGTTPVIDLTSGVVTAGTTGSSTLIPVVTVDTYGRVTSITTASNPQGTVTSVGGTGTVNGLTLTGTVTTTGNLTLGGTLDLSSPPAIGGTTPSTGTFTTLIGGKDKANYIQAVGGATTVAPVVSAQGSDTNIPLVLQPKGTGALQAQLTDSTATGGNARGANAVDWQTQRGSASAVASAGNSVIGGGYNNTNSAQYGVISGGYSNTNNGYISTLSGGNANITSSQFTFVGSGASNTASNYYSSVVGGNSNTSAGILNFIGGGYTNSGTSGSTATTQSATMNGTTTVTLSSSNASIKVGQAIVGTYINFFPITYVAAISGTTLTLSQNASGSGTATLSFYTPHGVVVGGGNNQATGSYSFIGGGGDAGTAANRNVASGDWSFVGGGVKNVASGLGSVICGGGTYGSVSGNTASQTSSVVVGGYNNNSAGYGSIVIGGASNTANSTFTTVLGGNSATTRAIVGNMVAAPCNIPVAGSQGVSQIAFLVLGTQTTDATATVLRSDTNAAGSYNQVILPNNSAYYFRGEIIAGVTGAGNTKGWYIEGVIKRGANVASTTLVGSTVSSLYADAGAVTWTIGLTADTTNGGLAVTATGQASTTIRWVAQIRTTEMTY